MSSTAAKSPLVFLDVTRLVSRLTKEGAFTGIDRVELAYMRYFLSQDSVCFGVLRSAAGIIILDRRGLEEINAWTSGSALPTRLGLLARLSRPKDPARAALESALRAHAVSRAPLPRAGTAIRRARSNLAENTALHQTPAVYLNVGHSNLSETLLREFKNTGALKIVVMLHDVIPLSHPHFSRLDPQRAFIKKVTATSKYADLVLHLRESTRAQTEQHLKRFGRVPAAAVIPLGITAAPPERPAAPLEKDAPYFVAIGTIEPRKNIPLLLDVWDILNRESPPAPYLYLIGNTGWADPAVFARIARTPQVHMLKGLDDDACTALLSYARALVFPSLAEGFGLPPYEAASLGVPVLASDLPVLREGLEGYATFLDPKNPDIWAAHLRSLRAAPLTLSDNCANLTLPSWKEHFTTLQNIICKL